MAVLSEFTGEAAHIGPLAESAAGIAVIVLAILGLADVAPAILASVAAIIVGGGIMAEALNAGAEALRPLATVAQAAGNRRMAEIVGRTIAALMAGVTGVVLGILGVFAIRTADVIPSALVVFGGYLVLSGAVGVQAGAPAADGRMQALSPRGSATAGWFAIVIGLAALVLGSLALVPIETRVLTLVGFIAVGAALLMIGGTLHGAVLRLLMAGIAPER